MEDQQVVDLERIYQMFLDKTKIDPNEVVSKKLEASSKNGCASIHVVKKHNDILAVYDAFYSDILDKVVDCYTVFFCRADLEELLEFLS